MVAAAAGPVATLGAMVRFVVELDMVGSFSSCWWLRATQRTMPERPTLTPCRSSGKVCRSSDERRYPVRPPARDPPTRRDLFLRRGHRSVGRGDARVEGADPG